MQLHDILGNLASLILLTAYISISVANPLPNAAADVIKTPHPLTKRTNHVTLSGLTLRGSRPLATILPIQIAASQFESLYTGLYHKATSELYKNYHGSSSFTLSYNIFEISFVTNDVVSQAVPWDFVRDFAIMMRIMSLRGYTGCYDQGYWNEVGDFGIYVALRIMAPLNPAPRV